MHDELDMLTDVIGLKVGALVEGSFVGLLVGDGDYGQHIHNVSR